MIEEPTIIEVSAITGACIHLVIPGREMPKYIDPAIAEILKALNAHGTSPAGPLFSYHLRRPSDTFDFELGFPVEGEVQPQGRVRQIMRPAFRVARVMYIGPYEELTQGWMALHHWVRERKLNEDGRFWECYITDPDEEPDPTKWRTELNWVLEAL